jgi:hypothetical protein
MCAGNEDIGARAHTHTHTHTHTTGEKPGDEDIEGLEITM